MQKLSLEQVKGYFQNLQAHLNSLVFKNGQSELLACNENLTRDASIIFENYSVIVSENQKLKVENEKANQIKECE